jgi:Flp pilus assembly pilin Flp
MLKILLRLMRDDDGQDIIEYALLTAGIGIVTVTTFPLIETHLHDAYVAIDDETQAIWEVPDPGSN